MPMGDGYYGNQIAYGYPSQSFGVSSGASINIQVNPSEWAMEAAAAPKAKAKEQTPLDWLRSQVDEICAVGAAV